MRERFIAYLFACLVAIIASIIPAAIYADFITPFSDWENIMWAGQPQPRPHYSAANLPPPLRIEMLVFKVLVVPPGWVAMKLSRWPTVYSAPYVSRVIYETAGVPPLSTALNHLRWALPFWFVALVVAFELARFIIRRAKRAA